MKHRILIPAFFFAALLVIAACNKKSSPITQTIEKTVNLGATETFTMTLPKSEFPYEITTQASHAKVSAIAPDANGNLVYTYQYAGSGENLLTDDVIIANPEKEGKCDGQHHHPGDSLPPPPPGPRHDSLPPPPPPHKKGKCDHEQDTLRTIKIHFNIN
jgi:hypothetical protein